MSNRTRPVAADGGGRDAVRAALVLAFVAVVLLGGNVLSRLDDLMFDFTSGLAREAVPANVVLVEIDGRSLAALGRWPWSRQAHARLVDRLTAVGAGWIAYDVAFPEPDPSDATADAALAAAIRRNGKVILPVAGEGAGPGRDLRPLPSLVAAAARLGHAGIHVDPDGRVRRLALPTADGGTFIWPFALALGVGALQDLTRPREAGWPEALVARDEALVPFGAQPDAIPRVSFSDVLDDDAVARRLEGKLVLVGVTAPGLAQQFLVDGPHGMRALPGAEIQVRFAGAVVARTLVQPATVILTGVATFVVGLAALMLFTMVSHARPATAWFVLGLVALGAVSGVLLFVARVWLSPVVPGAMLLTGYVAWWYWHVRLMAVQRDRDRRQFEAAVESSPDAVLVVDGNGRIVHANRAADWLVPPQADRSARSLVDLLESRGAPAAVAIGQAIARCVTSGAAVRPAEVITLRSADAERRFRVAVTPVAQAVRRAESARVVVVLHDVAGNEALADTLRFYEDHEPLTGLANRMSFMRTLAAATTERAGADGDLAVMALQLDGFDRIDHAFGAAVGDRVLLEAARRLEALLRTEDKLSHWDRGTFWMMVRGSFTTAPAAERLKVAMAAFAEPVVIEDRELRLSACAGVARFPDDGENAEALLRKAAVALRRFRANVAEPATDGDHGNGWDRGELELQLDLARAIERDELVLHYQPQIDAGSGRVVGFEALIRWNHPRHGLLGADRIVPAAEASDLILAVGEWVMHAAAWQLAAWRKSGMPDITMSVNVSQRQVWRADLIDLARRVIDKFGLERGSLQLELTESLLMRSPDACAAMIAAARHHGVGVSIDDFGTGFSSLSHLRLPVDQLKIDQLFVRDLPGSAKSATIVDGVISMAHSLGVSVVAEGVETAAQVRWLTERGCDKLQGHWFGRPVPASDVRDLVRQIHERAGLPT